MWPSALHISKWEIKALPWWKLIHWFLPPVKHLNFYIRHHKSEEGRKAGGFLHTQMLMLVGPVTFPSHCSTSKAWAPWSVCTSNPADPEWALSISMNRAAGISGISSQLPHSSRPSQKQVSCLLLFLWNVLLTYLTQEWFTIQVLFPPAHSISTLCTKGQFNQWSHVWGIIKHSTGTRS